MKVDVSEGSSWDEQLVKRVQVDTLGAVTVGCGELVVLPRFSLCMRPEGNGWGDLRPDVCWNLKVGAHERSHEETFPTAVLRVRLVADGTDLAEFICVERFSPFSSCYTRNDLVCWQIQDDERFRRTAIQIVLV